MVGRGEGVKYKSVPPPLKIKCTCVSIYTEGGRNLIGKYLTLSLRGNRSSEEPRTKN